MLEYSIETPVFGLIVCFVMTVLLGEFFNSHFNAFVIKSPGAFSVVNLWSLQDYRPITVKSNSLSSDRQLYALLPYYY